MTADVDRTAPAVEVEHVLVPLDGSELALAAMPTARALCERLGAELHAISVAGGAADRARLAASAASALGVDVGDAHIVVVDGADPGEAVTKRARELGSTVVCMSTHGRGRLSGAVVGSVARSVVQRSTEPVVVLGPSADRPGWSPRPRSWPVPLSIRRIVACVDGSETSEEILPVAAAWAHALAMTLTILTIVEDTGFTPGTDGRFGDTDPEAYVNGLVAVHRGSGVDVSGEVISDPIGPASGIRSYLDRRPAGLVALSTHARSGIQRVRFGAAAASIVHASPAPCLVIAVGDADRT